MNALLHALAAAVDETAAAPADFRQHVWIAYGLVLLLLALFTLWTLLKARRLDARVAHLEERLRKAHPESAPESAS